MATSVSLPVPTTPARFRLQMGAGRMGLAVLLLIGLACLLSLPWSIQRYDVQRVQGVHSVERQPPGWSEPMGTDVLGRSLLWRCLLGGAISLGIGISAALISVIIGATWGAVAGYAGGRLDALMMRTVDVLYGLPYILLVVLVNIAIRPGIEQLAGWALRGLGAAAGWVGLGFTPNVNVTSGVGNVVTLLIAIGGLSWLTMARVIRGQVLSLRSAPFVEAARAGGVGPWRILRVHLLPNMVGPIVVYATLTVPAAILQESFLSFLGIGVQAPLPSWGGLAAEGLPELHNLVLIQAPMLWWLLFWPCALLGLTLLALNFVGDALRNRLDPRSGRQA